MWSVLGFTPPQTKELRLLVAINSLVLDITRNEWDPGELALFEQLVRRSWDKIPINARREDESNQDVSRVYDRIAVCGQYYM